jgi:WD40 repeat protein
MSYCLNPKCQKPNNPNHAKFCSSCGTRLLLGDRYRALQPLSQEGIGRTFLGIDEQDTTQSRCIIKQLSGSNQGTNNPEKAAEIFRQEINRLSELGQHPQIPELLAYFEPDTWGKPLNTAVHTCSAPTLVQTFIEGQSLAKKLESEGTFKETQIRQILNELLPVIQFIHEHHVIHRDINPDNIIRCTSPLPKPSGQPDRHKINSLVLVDFSAAKFTTKTALAKTGTLIGSAAYTAPEQLRGKAETSSDLYSLGVTCIYLLTNIHPFYLFNSLEGVWVWQDYLCHSVSDELRRILNKMLEYAINQRYQSALDILQDLNPKTNLETFVELTTRITPISNTAPKSLKPTWNCVRTLTGHHSSITAIAFSPDGGMIVSGSADRTVKIWNPNSRLSQATLSGHSSLIDAVAISSNGKILVSGSWDYTIKIWDLETQELLDTLCQHSGWIKSLAISPDGKYLVSGSADKTVKIWDLERKEVKQDISAHSMAVHAVAISPNGQIIASGSADKTIKVWNLNTGEILLTLDGHSDAIHSLAFSPSSQILISGSADSTIKMWDLDRGVLLNTLTGHSAAVNSVTINCQGNTILSGSSDKTIKIWHPGSGDLLDTLTEHVADVTSVIITLNSRMIASSSQDKTIKIWQFGQ